MPIEFRCHSCDRILRTPDESAGKKARCPQCSAIVDIPLSSLPPGESGGSGVERGAGGFDAAPFGALGASGDSKDATASNPFGESASSFAPRADSPHSETERSTFGETNPYAAPAAQSFATAAIPGAEPLGEIVATRADLGDLLQTTWNICGHDLGMTASSGLVYMGINIAISIATNVLVQIGVLSRDQAIVVITQIFAQLIGFIAQKWLQVGLAYVALRWARKGQPQHSDYFAAGPYYLRALGISMLTGLLLGAVVLIFCGLPAVAGGVLGGQPEHAAIGALAGSLIALPLMSYIGLSLYISTYFLIDRQTGVVESMSLSNQFMSGNRLTILLLVMVMSFGAGMVMLLTCCIGSVVVIPFGGLLSAVAYLRITGQPVFQVPTIGPPQLTGTAKN